jgi:antitoxin MazE
MEAAIAKWGNSLALRLPRRVAEGAGLSLGSRVELQVDGDRLIIALAKPKYKLSELLAQHKPEHRHEEVDWGPAQGKEVW